MIKTETITTVEKRGKIRKTIGLLCYIYVLLEIISIIYTLILNFFNSLSFNFPQQALIPFFISYYTPFYIILVIIDIPILILIGWWLRKDKIKVVTTTIEISADKKENDVSE